MRYSTVHACSLGTRGVPDTHLVLTRYSQLPMELRGIGARYSADNQYRPGADVAGWPVLVQMWQDGGGGGGGGSGTRGSWEEEGRVRDTLHVAGDAVGARVDADTQQFLSPHDPKPQHAETLPGSKTEQSQNVPQVPQPAASQDVVAPDGALQAPHFPP